MYTEFAVLLLVFMLALILTVYNHRQAAALRGIEALVADFVAMQIRDRRAKVAHDLQQIDPLAWLAKQASAGLDEPILLTETLRVIKDVQAAEFRAEGGRHLVVSILPKADLLRFDRRLRAGGGKSAAARVENFTAHPLLGKSRWGWGVTVIERAMACADVSEFFDLEAAEVADRLGLNWGQPTRLWFYVVG